MTISQKTQGKIFVEDEISAYEYSKIRVRKCSALSQNDDSKLWTLLRITVSQVTFAMTLHREVDPECTTSLCKERYR